MQEGSGHVRLVMINGNHAMTMSTLKETSTTMSSGQGLSEGSSSHQQLPVHIAMAMLKWPETSYLAIALTCTLTYLL